MCQLPPDSQAATASQLTPPSAFAVPAPSAIGATTSAPAMVASPNVLRMFFNFDPLAKRAPKDARDHADEMPGFQAVRSGSHRLGRARQREARAASPGIPPGRRSDLQVRRSPAHTQVLGFEIICSIWRLRDRTNLLARSHVSRGACRGYITDRSRRDQTIVYAGKTPLLRKRGKCASGVSR